MGFVCNLLAEALRQVCQIWGCIIVLHIWKWFMGSHSSSAASGLCAIPQQQRKKRKENQHNSKVNFEEFEKGIES